ncbi:MAG: hypothetical protein ACREKE_02940 [bacterium]
MNKTLLALSMLGLALLPAGLVFSASLQPAGPELLAQATTLEQNEAQDQGGQNIGDEDVEAKDPYMATIFSVLPGVLFHGMGNFYAGDYDFGTEMLVMEIIGGGISVWGYNIIHQPQHWGAYFGTNTTQAGYWIKAFGVGLLAVSWVGDIATAPGAAEDWNKDHQLELQMDSFNATGMRLTAAINF